VQCPQCQHDNPEAARFCNGCGARLETTCPECGQANPPGSRFCNACGTKLALASPAAPAPTTPAPESYTPKHLAERILTSRAALEGERKQVTVLFADLKGSMELLADRDPEEARRILDPVLERMMDAVHRYEGTVNQVMGDGIMALFGAPLAHEDHAVRACYAALRMQEAVKAYAQEVQRAYGLPLHIRVGLNSGEVVVRSIGSDLRMDYTAVGQTTHLAARMEQMAMPSSILLAPDTLRLAEGYVQVHALGPMAVKGMGDPVEVYELVSASTARSRLQAAAARGLTKFVGRDTELETLRRTLEQAGAGHGQVVALVGEPGVGKSRLVWELSHSHRTEGWLVLGAGSVSYGKATSYLPVIDLLKSYCGVETRDEPRRVREKVAGKVLMLDEALRPDLAPFLALLDVPVEDAAWQALDPPQRRQRTLDACKRLLLRESQEQPVLLVCEDLHWIDSETQALLDNLVESLPTARILLLVNYRPEYGQHWGHKTYYTQLRLDPLPPESAEALLGALLGADAGLGPLKRLLVARTEGNPFFLEESVRSLVETAVLAGEPGDYRLAQPLASTHVPATVQAVLAARIDRLPPEDKRLLQSAAVIGKDVPFVLVQAIAELREDALHQGLANLQAAEFLYETTLFPDLEYTFKHALTHEVTYSSLLQERRRAVHGQIVAAIETLYPDRLAEHVERLGHHALRGERWAKAVAYLQQAGAKAAARSAHREAVAYFEEALAALGHLPESRDSLEQAIDLRFDLRNSLYPLGERERVYAYLQEAETLAGALEDSRRLGWVSIGMSNYAWLMGDPDRAVEAGERARGIASPLEDVALQVETTYRLGQAYWALGDYRRATEFLTQTAEPLQGEQIHERFGLPGLPAVNARAWLAECLAELGEFAQGSAVGEEAVQIAEAVDHPFSLVSAYHHLGNVYVHKGDAMKAIPLLQRGLAVCQAAEIRLMFGVTVSALGYAYALAGRVGEALPLLEQGVERATSSLMLLDLLAVTRLNEAYLLVGRVQDVPDLAARTLTLTRECKARGMEAWALRLLGEIAAQADPPEIEQAESHYHQALALADELGMRPLVAHCHLGLGTLYQKTGRDDEARNELTTAAELYCAMNMTFWLERAETAQAQIAR
jgi:class 3 adenylate cyclase/tetratricopeptide (TPR) repeat protein